MMMCPRRSLILPLEEAQPPNQQDHGVFLSAAVSVRVSGIDARGILCLVMSRVQCRVGQIRITDAPLLATSVQ